VFIEPGHCILEGEPQGKHRNLDGVVHGSWYMAILDSALGAAVVSTQDADHRTPSVTFECKFLRPALIGKTYRAESHLIKVGKMMGHARADLTEVETGKLVATATGSFAVISRQKPKK